jgi:hypothetical protein
MADAFRPSGYYWVGAEGADPKDAFIAWWSADWKEWRLDRWGVEGIQFPLGFTVYSTEPIEFPKPPAPAAEPAPADIKPEAPPPSIPPPAAGPNMTPVGRYRVASNGIETHLQQLWEGDGVARWRPVPGLAVAMLPDGSSPA